MKNKERSKRSEGYYECLAEIVGSLGARLALDILESGSTPDGTDHFVVSPRDSDLIFEIWKGDDWIQLGDSKWGARGQIKERLIAGEIRLVCCEFDPEWESRVPMAAVIRETSTGWAFDLLFESRLAKKRFAKFLDRRESPARAAA